MKSRSIFLFLASNAAAFALSGQTVYKAFPSYLVDPVKSPTEVSNSVSDLSGNPAITVTIEDPFAAKAPAYDAVAAAHASAKQASLTTTSNNRVYRKRKKQK